MLPIGRGDAMGGARLRVFWRGRRDRRAGDFLLRHILFDQTFSNPWNYVIKMLRGQAGARRKSIVTEKPIDWTDLVLI